MTPMRNYGKLMQLSGDTQVHVMTPNMMFRWLSLPLKIIVFTITQLHVTYTVKIGTIKHSTLPCDQTENTVVLNTKRNCLKITQPHATDMHF